MQKDNLIKMTRLAFSNTLLNVLVRKGVISHHEADEAMRVLKQMHDDIGEKAA